MTLLQLTQPTYSKQARPRKEAFDEEEELPEDAMKTLRIYPGPYAKKSSTFQEELGRMVAEKHAFPCSFAGRYSLP